MMTANQLAECRENNNPYNWMGQPTRAAMFGPDPCITQARTHWEAQQEVDRLAGATTEDISAVQVAQTNNAPTAQDLASAPAPQLATGYEPVGQTDPAIPLTEYQVPSPGMISLWSPMSVDSTIEMILDEIEWETMEIEIREKVLVILEGLTANMILSRRWWCWGKGAKPLKLQFKPKNNDWIGRWSP
nr:NP [Feline chaphamaparvovirus]